MHRQTSLNMMSSVPLLKMPYFLKLYSIMADGIAPHVFTSHCTRISLAGARRLPSGMSVVNHPVLPPAVVLTLSSCTSGVIPPRITPTSMSCIVSGFDVLSCVTFMRSSKLAGFVRMSKQHHYQCLLGVNYIYSGTRYSVIIPRTWYSMQVVPRQ